MLIIMYILFAPFYYFGIKEIVTSLDVFYPNIVFVLMLLYCLFVFTLYVNKEKWQFIVYLLGLLCILFYRKSKVGYNFTFYLLDWVNYIFKNKTIAMNIIGNILIFVPLGYYLRNVGLSVTSVVCLELLQVLFKRGMFDVVDIFLNIIGVLIGVVIIWMKKRRNTTKKLIKMKM